MSFRSIDYLTEHRKNNEEQQRLSSIRYLFKMNKQNDLFEGTDYWVEKPMSEINELKRHAFIYGFACGSLTAITAVYVLVEFMM